MPKNEKLTNKTSGNSTRITSSRIQRRPALTIATALAFAFASTVVAQEVDSAPALLAENFLPDAPGSILATPAQPTVAGVSSSSLITMPHFAPLDSGRSAGSVALPTQKYISPGQTAPPLSVGNKVVLGLKDTVTPVAAFGWLISSGYEQAVNGSPNYGTNAKAFAQRLGASAARASSESIFSDSIAASVLHEDPRYYRMGSGNNPVKRVGYAISRVFITRTDSGRPTINASLIAGNLAGAYLTKVYYPSLNTTNTEVLKTFGGSLAGSAFGFGVNEFLSGAINLFHSRSSSN